MPFVRALMTSLVLLAATGCSLFQSTEGRQAELADAVADALEAEKGWQTRFVERRTDAMIADQRAIAGRTAEVEGRLQGLEERIDDLVRRMPSVADPAAGRPASVGSGSPTWRADTAEAEALRRDLEAMTGAVAQLLGERERWEAGTQARFERLELRTSNIPWPWPDAGGRRGVHLASYRDHQMALAGWEILAKRHASVLAAETPTFVEADTVAGRYVRLFVAVGEAESGMNALMNAVRQGGDYAMILPLPTRPQS